MISDKARPVHEGTCARIQLPGSCRKSCHLHIQSILHGWRTCGCMVGAYENLVVQGCKSHYHPHTTRGTPAGWILSLPVGVDWRCETWWTDIEMRRFLIIHFKPYATLQTFMIHLFALNVCNLQKLFEDHSQETLVQCKTYNRTRTSYHWCHFPYKIRRTF